MVDSIRPLEEEIVRFREAFAATVPPALSGGAASRDELVRRWVSALERRDSVALGRMLLNAAEFIAFYYPESPYTRPPYRQSPSLRWHLIASTSSQGATRVWQRHAGTTLGVVGHECNASPERMGGNRIWTDCVVRLRAGLGERRLQLFGPIIERDGQYKFLSYASDY